MLYVIINMVQKKKKKKKKKNSPMRTGGEIDEHLSPAKITIYTAYAFLGNIGDTFGEFEINIVGKHNK